jgi:uncharacterized protein YjdB
LPVPIRRSIASTTVSSIGVIAALLSCKGRDTTGPSPVESVAVAPASAVVLQINQTQQLTGTPLDVVGSALAGQTLAWSSSNPAIATVSPVGLVTAVAPGMTTITATCQGRSGTATVIVQLPVATMVVAQSSAILAPGLSLQLTATPEDVNGVALIGQTITWSSSNTAVATVGSKGLVTAVAVGTTTITATGGGVSGVAAITVVGSQTPVASVTIRPDSVVYLEGPSGFGNPVQLTATLTDANGSAVTNNSVAWSSSDTSIATVSQTGLAAPNPSVTVPSIATITAASGGKSGTAMIIVDPRALSVVVAPDTASVSVGATLQLMATSEDAMGDPEIAVTIIWASSNAAIATVSNTGLVTGIKSGTVSIFATDVFGRRGTATITVQ